MCDFMASSDNYTSKYNTVKNVNRKESYKQGTMIFWKKKRSELAGSEGSLGTGALFQLAWKMVMRNEEGKDSAGLELGKQGLQMGKSGEPDLVSILA